MNFRSLPAAWIDTLRPPRVSMSAGEHIYVTQDEVLALATYPVQEDDLALRRDQAAVVMLYLSGMRATAFTTLPIAAVNIGERSVNQWPEIDVRTRNGKRKTTFLLAIPRLLNVVESWDTLVRGALPDNTPWYTPVESRWGEQNLSRREPGANRHIALNKRIRVLYDTVGLDYKSAHKFRHGNAVYGLQHAKTMADYKAVSMNLMHEDIKITDQIYAPLLTEEVKVRIARLGGAPEVISGAPWSDLSREQLIAILARRLEG